MVHLSYACRHGRMDDVELFMNHPYHKYITNRDVNGYRDDMTLKDMVSQVGTNSYGWERTPLTIAAQNEHYTVKYLIEQGEADPNIAHSEYGWNGILQHVIRTSTELIELLLTNMTLIALIRRTGDTPDGHMHIIIIQFAKRSLHFYVQKVEKQINMMKMVEM